MCMPICLAMVSASLMLCRLADCCSVRQVHQADKIRRRSAIGHCGRALPSWVLASCRQQPFLCVKGGRCPRVNVVLACHICSGAHSGPIRLCTVSHPHPCLLFSKEGCLSISDQSGALIFKQSIRGLVRLAQIQDVAQPSVFNELSAFLDSALRVCRELSVLKTQLVERIYHGQQNSSHLCLEEPLAMCNRLAKVLLINGIDAVFDSTAWQDYVVSLSTARDRIDRAASVIHKKYRQLFSKIDSLFSAQVMLRRGAAVDELLVCIASIDVSIEKCVQGYQAAVTNLLCPAPDIVAFVSFLREDCLGNVTEAAFSRAAFLLGSNPGNLPQIQPPPPC